MTSPSWIWLNSSSSVVLEFLARISCLTFCCLWCAISFAWLDFLTALNWSPATGTSDSPRISTAVAGPAFFSFSPLLLVIRRILPEQVPATTLMSDFSVPLSTSRDAIGPLALSSLASSTVPIASLSGLAFSSSTSACSKIISSRLVMPSPVFADTGTLMTSPPQSSTRTPFSARSFLTISGFAPGLSILLMATMIGTPAAFAWLMDSMVCGLTLSSAATTSTAMSVACAPLALMAVNASCPGVSRNTIFCPLISTSDAPMCWVIPPDSPAVTFVFLMASSSEVLPWSTCPMTVMIGARGFRSSSLSSKVSMPSSSRYSSSSSTFPMAIWIPISSARS